MSSAREPIVVIGDVHGCAHTLAELLEHLPENAQIYLTGDILDRGPHVMEAWQLVQQHALHMVLGNHEWMFLHHRDSPEHFDLWLANGGNTTLKSIQATAQTHQEDPEHYIQELFLFCQNLPLYYEVPWQDWTLLISHAGVAQYWQTLERALQIPLEHELSLIWNRSPLADLPNTIQICGHTPVPGGPQPIGNNWYIDTGCVYTHTGLGYLSALIFFPDEPQPQILRIPRRDF